MRGGDQFGVEVYANWECLAVAVKLNSKTPSYAAPLQLFLHLILWITSEPNYRDFRNLQIPIGIVWERLGCVLGIEPNEHRIPRFQVKYSYHTEHSVNPERPNSPNVLPMSRVMLGCGILRFCKSQCFSGEHGRTVRLKWESSELLWIRMVS